MSNKQVNKYCAQVRSWLPCGMNEKKRIFGEIRRRVSEILEEQPNADFDGIVQHFGTPQQIASAYVDEMELPELLRQMEPSVNIQKAHRNRWAFVYSIGPAYWNRGPW